MAIYRVLLLTLLTTLVSGTPKALFTLSQKSATVAENGQTTAKFGDCRDSFTFLRQIVALFCDSVDRF